MGLWLVGLALLAWKLMCTYMRKRRSELLAKLDPLQDHSHAITSSSIFLEFPFLYQRSLEMATLRNFAIPSISRTLQKSGQYARNPSKRYDDTDILLQEMIVHHVDSPRGSLALRRLNYLHSHYTIDNADYLYVLCILMVLPAEWASMYGYRAWTELEKSSIYNTWHDIATRMGIHDIPSTFAAAAKYRDDFEAKHMAYADSNHVLAELNMKKLLLNGVPTFLQPLARRLIYGLMDDRLRTSLGYPKQPAWISTLSHTLLKLHGSTVRWMPPRPLAAARRRIFSRCPALTSHDEATDAIHLLAFQRYKPSYYKQGYRITELGGLKAGGLVNAFGGTLVCPLQKCNTLPWPDVLSKRGHRFAQPLT